MDIRSDADLNAKRRLWTAVARAIAAIARLAYLLLSYFIRWCFERKISTSLSATKWQVGLRPNRRNGGKRLKYYRKTFCDLGPT